MSAFQRADCLRLRAGRVLPRLARAGFGCKRRATRGAWPGYGLTLALFACSGSIAGPRNASAVRPGTESRAPTTRVPATLVTRAGAVDTGQMFADGQTALRQGRPADAALLFDSIWEHDSEGVWAPRALMSGGLAHEATGDLEAATRRFEQLYRRFPSGDLALAALVRALRVRLHLGHFARAGELGVALEQGFVEAPPLATILAGAARALALVERGQEPQATYHAARGMAVVDRYALDRAGRIPRDLAVLFYALGETRRLRAEAAHLAPEPSRFAAHLERRCELLLAAQSAYSDAMRAYDSHWSTLAGFRVGQLYESLHREVMQIPPPRPVDQAEAHLFEGAMRLRYSVLLRKGLTMMQHTLAMAARTGERSVWVERTRLARADLERALDEEDAFLDSLPYTREQLREALERLRR